MRRVSEVRGEGSVRVAVLTGAGRAFSAGGDLAWLLARHRDSPANNCAVMQEFYRKFLSLRDLEVPVIAAINGPAIGAGLCLALGGADIRVMSEAAKLGVTFTKLGLHPGMAATHFLPQLAGPQVAAELLLTGRLVNSQEAVKLGLVARVAEDAMVLIAYVLPEPGGPKKMRRGIPGVSMSAPYIFSRAWRRRSA